MSDIALFKNLPAHLRNIEGLDETTKALMGGGTGGTKRISIEGGVWRMMVNGNEVARNEERSMNVVIVAAAPKVSRTFYAGVYKKGVASPPDCWSADGEKPDAKAANPQSKTCATCPQNVKGSGQGDSRACRFSQRLAVVLENDVNGDVYQLTHPSQSIFGEGEPGKWPLQTYARMLGSKGVPITAVVTEARFDTNAATPKLTFKAVRPLTEEEFATCQQVGQSPTAKQAVTFTVSKQDGVKQIAERDAEFRSNDKPAVAKKAAEPEAEATEEAPTKRTTKPAAPGLKKDAKALLAEWDD